MDGHPNIRRGLRQRRDVLAIALVCGLLGVITSGCRQSGGMAPKETHSHMATPSFSDRLARANASWRNAVLLRAITDSDRSCDRVTDTAYQQAYKQMGMWRVRCHDGGDWAVFIASTGNAQVAQCSSLSGDVPRCNALHPIPKS